MVLLDVMLPGIDGWQVLREIRKKSDIPIMMLTAKSETFDELMSFDLKADEHISKPFDAKIVIARIKNLLRRSGSLNAEPEVKEVCYDKLSVNMTRYELPDEVWGFEYYGDSRTIDVHIKRLREKLEGVSDKWLLKTVWGVGYKFEAEEE